VARTLGVLTATRFITSTGYRFVYPFLPAIARGLDVSLQQAGLLVSARSLAGAAAPLALAVAGRERRRRTVSLAMALFVAGMAVTAAAGVYPGAMIGFVMVGLSKPAFDVSAHAYLADRVPYQRRARYLAFLEIAWASGLLAGAPAAGWAIGRFGWRAPFWILACVATGIALVLHRSLERDLPPSSGSRIRLRPSRSALALLGLVGLFGVAADMTLVVVGAWLEDRFGLTLIALGGVVTAIAVAELVAEGSAAAFADRLGKRRSVVAGLIVAIAGYAALAAGSATLAAGMAGLVVAFAGFEFAYVSSIPLASEAVPESRGRFLALYVVAFFVGRTVGAAVGPALFGAGGLPLVAAAAAAVQVAGLGIVLTTVREA
jgi:predicted MFS family arabinose efflux permease